ncbi:queuosine precursor transporter [Pseudomonas brassicacearum]|uniref:queuosine precursor transporter n=1 Tax=Pseudomonas brassicacearum TaxID=930166 RepID=UPI001D93DAF2|nr:queuosine precursor transporter [Pseudomonas brassicacearum]CAH0237924.1 hypothetical protein SRABI06_02817 [Pseudomonas brassicacearum]
MDGNGGSQNIKYKLLGFEKSKSLAIIMVISTGRVVKIKLNELLKSEIIDDLAKVELREIYKKFYSGGAAVTAYEMSDRHERSWMVYVVLSFILFVLYMLANISAAKLVYIEQFDVVVTPGVFLYPLTFLAVDILNESYGLRLARKAILFVCASNAFVLMVLSFTSWLPGSPGWQLDEHFGEVINHMLSVLVASSASFLLSEYVNSYLLSRIKELTNSRFLFLRVFLSTFIAVIVDSFLFCYIAFHGSLQNQEILQIVYVQIVIKMFFSIFNVFPAYAARSLFKKYVVGAQPA